MLAPRRPIDLQSNKGSKGWQQKGNGYKQYFKISLVLKIYQLWYVQTVVVGSSQGHLLSSDIFMQIYQIATELGFSHASDQALPAKRKNKHSQHILQSVRGINWRLRSAKSQKAHFLTSSDANTFGCTCLAFEISEISAFTPVGWRLMGFCLWCSQRRKNEHFEKKQQCVNPKKKKKHIPLRSSLGSKVI